MGEHYDERREISDARERMSELAVEIAHRASPEYVKAQVKTFASDKKVELKQRAKETVMRKTTEWKQVATGTPKGIGMLGAIAGGLIGSIVAKRIAASKSGAMYERREYWDGRDEPTLYASHGSYEMTGDDLSAGSHGSGVGDKLQSAKASVVGKATDVKGAVMDKASGAMDSLRGTASNVRDHIPSAGEVRYRASSWYDRSVNDQPLFFALGALAFGMMASAFIPVSERERQMMEPAKSKVRETVSKVGGQLQQKVESIGGSADQQSDISSPISASGSSGDISGFGISDSGSIPAPSPSDPVPAFPPLDDLTTRH